MTICIVVYPTPFALHNFPPFPPPFLPSLSPNSQFMDILNYSADLKAALEALVVTREVSLCLYVHAYTCLHT